MTLCLLLSPRRAPIARLRARQAPFAGRCWLCRRGACLFRSRDFVDWSSAGFLHQSLEPNNTAFWECPDVFQLPNSSAWVLKVSGGGTDGDWWAVGELSSDGGRDAFVPRSYDIHGKPHGCSRLTAACCLLPVGC